MTDESYFLMVNINNRSVLIVNQPKDSIHHFNSLHLLLCNHVAYVYSFCALRKIEINY